MAAREPARCWLDLPDACLLEVAQCFAGAEDYRSLFSFARSHSRLHQAAVAALCRAGSITVVMTEQEQVDSMMLYLERHSHHDGHHISSVNLQGPVKASQDSRPSLRELPPDLQLSSMHLKGFKLQLLPFAGFRGVLGAAAMIAALKQLCISGCALFVFDNDDGLDEALAQLLGLQYLSVTIPYDFSTHRKTRIPPSVLQRMLQLTYLELFGNVRVAYGEDDDDEDEPPQPTLQPLPSLVDLRLGDLWGTCGHALGLAGTHLTRLDVQGFEPVPQEVLTGKTLLQHQDLTMDPAWGSDGVYGDTEGLRQLLADLQPLQHLTHLGLGGQRISTSSDDRLPPAAAFSTITASSNLQHLDISDALGVWQHIFPAGRQLPHLTSLNISDMRAAESQYESFYAPAPEGSLLVSCCPNLQFLDVQRLTNTAKLLPHLQGLSRLHTLVLSMDWDCKNDEPAASEYLQAVAQLTRLKRLKLTLLQELRQLPLLQLAQLKQLTSLTHTAWDHRGEVEKTLQQCAALEGGDEPVWRQIVRLHLNHSDPAVVQQAAAALAE